MDRRQNNIGVLSRVENNHGALTCRHLQGQTSLTGPGEGAERDEANHGLSSSVFTPAVCLPLSHLLLKLNIKVRVTASLREGSLTLCLQVMLDASHLMATQQRLLNEWTDSPWWTGTRQKPRV